MRQRCVHYTERDNGTRVLYAPNQCGKVPKSACRKGATLQHILIFVTYFVLTLTINKRKSDCLTFFFYFFRDTVIVCVADAFTAFYGGLVVFSVLGFLAKETNKPIEEFATSGIQILNLENLHTQKEITSQTD